MAVPSCLSSSLLTSVWRADELVRGAGEVVSSGHAALDAELPGGGWPLGALIELLQPSPTAAVWPLLWPALARRLQAGEAGPARASVRNSRQAAAAASAARNSRVVVLNPPHEPCLPAFAAAGIPAAQLLWLAPSTPAEQLWAAEQALRCQDVAALVAWLPRVRVAELRRLQQAAAQTGMLLFVLRPDGGVRDAATPARLRLRVGAALPPPPGRPKLRLVGVGGVPDAEPATACGLPQLRIELLKRRGPPRDAPLWLPACGPALAAVLQAALGQEPRRDEPPHDAATDAGGPVPRASASVTPLRQRAKAPQPGARGRSSRPALAAAPASTGSRRATADAVHGEGGHALAGASVAAA
jgi:protein ImuA